MVLRPCLLALTLLVAPHLDAAVVPVPLRDVRLLDGPFKHAEELNRAWLLSLDPERFLYHFRVNAGLPTTAQPYGGWEAPDWDFAGHILGHYLSACALMAAHDGDAEFRRRVDTLVAGLAECQAALARTASHPGFLDPQPEAVFARLESGGSMRGVPFYTMHKTLAGLLDAHQLAGNRQALAVLEGLAAWLKFRLDRLTPAQIQTMLRIEHGGLSEAFANLHGLTKNPDHLALAERLNHQLFFAPFARGEDPLGPGPGPAASRLLHGNTQVPKALGAAREYELTGNAACRAVATNFWRNVARTRSFIFGGNTDGERFFARGTEAQHLTRATGEGCNTSNMLRLTRHLFAWEPTAETMDFYERALFNHILALQNPRDGSACYFLPLLPGFRKIPGTPDNTMWCCTGTSMENHARHADTIYWHDDATLYVNLFIASEMTWREKGFGLRQETRFPDEDTLALVVRTAAPQRLTLKVRVPYWSGAPTVTINGEPQRVAAAPSSYLALEHEWRDGDRVAVRLPMTLRAVPLPDDPAQVAFMFGPLVLAGNLGRDGLDHKPRATADNGKNPRGPRVPEEPVFVPGLVGAPDDFVRHIKPVPGAPLTFRTEGIGRPQDVTLVPLHRIVDESYTVYWRIYDETGWQKSYAIAGPREEARRKREAAIVDAVWAGDAKSEAAHAVSPEAPLVSSRMHLFRDATHVGVTWRLKAAAGEPMTLRVGFVGAASSAFDVFVGEQKVGELRPAGTVAQDDRATTSLATFAVPAAATRDRPVVEVRCVGRPEGGTAHVVFCEFSRLP